MTAPNFVLIMTDTQGANMVGAYGRPEQQTPCLDRLAADGVTFERAYTTTPLCTPARAALFTGRYSHAVGAWVNGLPLGSTAKHMGQRFRDSGYRTAHTGKWHLDGHDYFGTGACPDGWDDRYWLDGKRFLESLSAEDRLLWRRELRTPEALREHNVSREFTWGHQVSNRAIEFLQDIQNVHQTRETVRTSAAGTDPQQPFLLVVSYDEPHDHYTCPPEYVDRFLDYEYHLGPGAFDDLADKPQYQRDWAASRATEPREAIKHPMYFGCNSFIDSEIGRVIDAVDRYAPANTYVIYTSDHGDMLGSHGLYMKDCAVYEEITHIPLFIRPPHEARAGGGAPAGARGTRIRAAVSHIDLLPTMMDLAGLEAPPVLEGNSLASMLRGEAGADDPERAVFIEFHRFELPGDGMGGFAPMRAIVKGRYKLAINLLDTDELYDLHDDPAEVRNRIEDPTYAGVRDALHDELIDWMYQNVDPFRGTAWERRPWRTSYRLRWTGGWTGQRRPQDDGYAPARLNYGTGLPLA